MERFGAIISDVGRCFDQLRGLLTDLRAQVSEMEEKAGRVSDKAKEYDSLVEAYGDKADALARAKAEYATLVADTDALKKKHGLL